MISLSDYYMGRDKTHNLTDELIANATETVKRVNLLLEKSGFDRGVRSGWRPADINANIPNAAQNSKHITCEACDLEDGDSRLGKWCLANLSVLEEIGLWMETKGATPTWVHVQTKAPASGHRVFIP